MLLHVGRGCLRTKITCPSLWGFFGIATVQYVLGLTTGVVLMFVPSDDGHRYFGSKFLDELSVVRCVLFRWHFSRTQRNNYWMEANNQDKVVVSACYYLSMGNCIGSGLSRKESLLNKDTQQHLYSTILGF